MLIFSSKLIIVIPSNYFLFDLNVEHLNLIHNVVAITGLESRLLYQLLVEPWDHFLALLLPAYFIVANPLITRLLWQIRDGCLL